jgi:cell division protein FtsB
MIDTSRMTNGEKAKLYDQLLSDHSRKAAQVRSLETDITPKPGQQEEINKLKAEMVILERDATNLAAQAF